MSEEIKDIMDALENNELKNDGFWGRACSRLSQQLLAAKEENEKLSKKLERYKTIDQPLKSMKEYSAAIQQNKQMREALNWLETLLRENYNDKENQIICVVFAYEKIQQALKDIDK